GRRFEPVQVHQHSKTAAALRNPVARGEIEKMKLRLVKRNPDCGSDIETDGGVCSAYYLFFAQIQEHKGLISQRFRYVRGSRQTASRICHGNSNIFRP